MSETGRKLLIAEIIFSFGTMFLIVLNFVLNNSAYMTTALITGSVMLGLMSARRFVDGKKGLAAFIGVLALFVFFSAILEFV
ncbi:cbb3-type cytochrome oxidase subunit 3 [Alkalibacillus flavidus]|uniref:Cbb3-type cytochrome oxidase subunit 3 n=1 Tax=Alkalibacillus flavidus TaxID=546021 RepID=A0ABV2KVM9_9BACI